MDTEPALGLLVDGFDRVHEGVARVVRGASPGLLAYRPDAAANPAAWLLWHLTRIQDDHVAGIAEVLSGRRAPARRGEHRVPGGQLWSGDGWRERFGLPYGPDETGFGQSAEQVGDFGPVDPGLLTGYHAAVHERTLGLLGRLGAVDYTSIVDERWDPAVTTAVRLMSVLNDTSQHLGQASYVRGLAERAGV